MSIKKILKSWVAEWVSRELQKRKFLSGERPKQEQRAGFQAEQESEAQKVQRTCYLVAEN